MRANKETYEHVAKECSAYKRKEYGMTNSTYAQDSCPSCLNCTHFASDEHCVLDLYDPIVKNI